MRSEPRNARISVCPLSISLAATLEIDFSFSSSGYLDVSVHRVPFHTLCVGVWMTGVFPAGFPHSDISGSLLICSSPKLFAAYHVFLRLLVPRHPPCALDCLISSKYVAWYFSKFVQQELVWFVNSCSWFFYVYTEKSRIFSDVLIFKIILKSLSLLYEVFKLLSGLSTIRKLSLLNSLMIAAFSGDVYIWKQTSFAVLANPAATCFPMPSPA